MKKIITIALILILSGCTSHTVNIYDLAANSVPAQSKRFKNRVLKVEFPSALGALGSSRIFYKRDGITSYYLYSRWSDTLNRLVYSQLKKALEESGSFKSVLAYNSSAKADIILETEIMDFYHVVKGNSSYADIKFSAKLIDSNSRKVIKSKIFSYKLKVDELNAKSFIKTAIKAVSLFIEELTMAFFKEG